MNSSAGACNAVEVGSAGNRSGCWRLLVFWQFEMTNFERRQFNVAEFLEQPETLNAETPMALSLHPGDAPQAFHGL
jgi:hypothetical protein